MALDLIYVPRVQNDHGSVREHHLEYSPALIPISASRQPLWLFLAHIEQDLISYLTEALLNELFRR